MPLTILKNQSLLPYNTFGMDVYAEELIVIHSVSDLLELLPYLRTKEFLFLGGGSNILLTKNFDGIAVINQLKGKQILSKNDEYIEIEALSGEVWHELVLWTIEQGAFGLENMSLIPGSVGAAPMQNIGAYGEEIKHWCVSVEAIDLSNGELRRFTNEECQFGYRESVFKRALKNQYFIYKVHFKLNTKQSHKLNCEYGAIQEILNSKWIQSVTPKDVSDAVIEIRSSKLPNPKELGNAGSFFKNPVIDVELFSTLILKYPDMPSFNDVQGKKIPAGWLIEKAGFKGKKVGNTGSHIMQALVIVNYGNATGTEIYDYSQSIIDAIKNQFGIILEREVNIM